MRILQIIDNINIDAGVASIVMNIYRNIDRSKYQFDFLISHHGYTRGKTYESEIESYGGRIFYFGAPLSVDLLKATHNAKKFFKEHSQEYDAVHLHTPTIAEFTIKYAKQYGINKIITHSHSAMTSTNRVKSIINDLLIHRIKKYTNNYWACSISAAKYMFGNDFCNSNHIVIIKNAILPDKYSFCEPLRNELRIERKLDDKIVFIHVSNYTKIKNTLFIVPVIKKVIKENPLFHFMFVGDGPELVNLKNEIEKFQLTSFCSFVGATDDVDKYLQIADAFFMPSLAEGFGIAAVEAQASGLPCFLSIGVPKEVEVGKVSYIPLVEQRWYEKISSFKTDGSIERKHMSDSFRDSCLNIRNSITSIENSYDSLKTVW